MAAHSGSATTHWAVNLEKGARCFVSNTCSVKPTDRMLVTNSLDHLASTWQPTSSGQHALTTFLHLACRDRVSEDAVASRLLLRALAHASGLRTESQALSTELRDGADGELQVLMCGNRCSCADWKFLRQMCAVCLGYMQLTAAMRCHHASATALSSSNR